LKKFLIVELVTRVSKVKGMKIFFSGYHNPYFITITEYIEEAIKSLGHELIVFDDREHIRPGRIRGRIRWLHELDLMHINTQFISLALNAKPDVVIVTGGHRILPQSVQKLRDNDISVILWTIDAPINFGPIITAAHYYHRVFCGGTEAQEILEKNGILDSNWLPFACDPEFHRPIYLTSKEKITYPKEIVFIGSFYPNRWKILKELNEFDIGIWGPHWNKDHCESLGRLSINNVQLKQTEWIRIFAAAKIVIVLHFQDEKTPCYQASPKVYEALACNRFVLVDRQKDVFSLFDDRKHLVSFDNVEDLKEKIIYYLENSNERERIAAKGYEEVLKKHTYVHRMKHMLSMINT
jgi:spore maturation protein CgeB